jgi:hypothetical protein
MNTQKNGRDTMPPQDLERKLTAILSADVAGYTRLMREGLWVYVSYEFGYATEDDYRWI